MKHHRSHTPHPPARSTGAGRPGSSRATSLGVFTGAALAALLAALPVDVTVTLGDPAARPVVVVGQAEVPNPICQAH